MAAAIAIVDGLPLDEQPSAACLTGPFAAAPIHLYREVAEIVAGCGLFVARVS